MNLIWSRNGYFFVLYFKLIYKPFYEFKVKEANSKNKWLITGPNILFGSES